MPNRRAVALCLIALLCSSSLLAQSSDKDLLARIRKEESDNSQIMKTMHMFTDVYGPRLTGSPNHKHAAEWASKQMQEWGFDNTHLESWDFGHPGWLNERLTAHLISPVKDALVCEVLAWTPSTRGPIQAKAFQLVLPEKPTQEQLTAFFDNEKAKVRGRIVLAGKRTIVPVNLNPPARRSDDKTVEERFGPNARPFAFPTPSPTPTPAPNAPKPLTPRQVDEQLDKFLKEQGALLRVNDAGREHRQIRAFNNRTFKVAAVVPTVVMSNEDYGRISRILADGTEVVLEFDIVNRIYPEGKTSFNTIGEIQGTDKADEVIMLGGHLDSWHAATGATDNAIGCAIMMEAARILKTLGVKPRRTIRVALWSGEEQGLLGSQAYVKEHFGSFENPKPGYEKFGGYFNIDSGTGRVRGASVFGPPEAAAVMRKILEPLKEDGVVGTVASRGRNLGGSDNTSFSQAGLPGIGMGQDPIEYGTHTWHTNLDTYERIVEEDVKKDAVTVAWSIYQLAMRDDLLPRFTKDKMPPRPPVDPAAQTQPAAKPVMKPSKLGAAVGVDCSTVAGRPRRSFMNEARNKQLVLDYVDAFNRGDIDALRQLFAPDALVYGVLGWGGLDQVVPIWHEIKAAFAIQLHVESTIAEGDIVAVRYVERGQSVGSFRGGPVTGKSFEVVAIEWFVIQDGKIHRRWGARDNASQLRQMGLPPT